MNRDQYRGLSKEGKSIKKRVCKKSVLEYVRRKQTEYIRIWKTIEKKYV